jgi:hypothetical protein
MSSCEYIQECPLFNNSNVRNMTELIEELKAAYCLGEQTQCARYNVFKALGKKAVPELMLPTQYAWAKQILRDSKSLIRNNDGLCSNET